MLYADPPSTLPEVWSTWSVELLFASSHPAYPAYRQAGGRQASLHRFIPLPSTQHPVPNTLQYTSFIHKI